MTCRCGRARLPPSNGGPSDISPLMTEEVMPQLVALSLSIAVLGAIWAYLALGPLAGFVLVWAGFIAWGCFFHTGGDQKALIKTICGNIWGVFVAWIALLIIVNANGRSEERRVGKECRSRWTPNVSKTKA